MFVSNHSTSSWRLGPAHPDYAAEPEIQNGFTMTRRFFLTDEGVRSVSRADSAQPEPAASCAQAGRALSSHIHCPPGLSWLCEGRLPVGWIREVKP